LLGLYTGTKVSELTTVASNDDAYDEAPLGFSALSHAVSSNQTYYIAVDGFDAASGTAYLTYSFTASPLFTLNLNSGGGGVVSPGSSAVLSNSTVVATATPDPFFEFANWSGSFLATANPLSVIVNSNIDLTANFRPISFTDDFETGNLEKLGWYSSGNLPWTVQSGTNVLAGTFSARSGAIGDGQTSSLIVTTNFRGGTGSFYYKVSSEPDWDLLGFYIDGVLQQQWSGEISWTTYSFPLSSGTHTLEWRYSKDPSLASGLDAAFIDNVNLPVSVAIDETSPAFLQIVRQTDGGLLLQIQGQTNQQYVIQGATTLTAPITWQSLSTNIATSGVIQFVDPGAGTNSIRFYRAIVQ